MNLKISARQNIAIDQFDTNKNQLKAQISNQPKIVDTFESAPEVGIGNNEVIDSRLEQEAAKRDQFANFVKGELGKYGVEIDPAALNNLSSTIGKGGNSGLYTSIALTYAIAKLAAGPPMNEGVAEQLTSLAENPDQAEEIMRQMICDPNFFPLSSEQLETINRLSTLPFGASSVQLGEILSKTIAQQFNPDAESVQQQEQALLKFNDVIPKIFLLFGSQSQDSDTSFYGLFGIRA